MADTLTSPGGVTYLDPVEIPIARDVPLYTERVRLDGADYLLRFDWSDREGRWFLELQTLEGTPLASGIKVVANHSLLGAWRYRQGFPPGELVAVDYSDQRGESPVLPELGRRVRLMYFPIAPKPVPVIRLGGTGEV